MRNSIKDQIKIGTEVFVKGTVAQSIQPETAKSVAVVGIANGFRHRSNVERAVKSTITFGVVLCCINGVTNVANNWNYIKG